MLSFFINFVVHWFTLPNQRSNLPVWELWVSLHNAFSSHLKSLVTLNIFVFRKCRWIFQRCQCFIFFLSTSGVFSVITSQNCNFLELNKIFSVHFKGSTCFHVELSHYWQVHFRDYIVGKIHRSNFSLPVFVFILYYFDLVSLITGATGFLRCFTLIHLIYLKH